MERLLTSDVSISNGNIKYPIEKLIFAVNFPLKLLPATVTNADIGSLKSLHKLFDKYLDHLLVKFEQNYMVQTTRNFEVFDKKTKQNKTKQEKKKSSFKPFLQSIDASLEDVSVAETILWCWTIVFQITIFQCFKNNGSLTCVTRLKVATNMVDSISTNVSRQ